MDRCDGWEQGMKNSEHTQPHIDSIAKQEQAFLEKRTLSERAGDGVAGFAGSLVFVMIHALLVLAWILVNAQGVQGIPRFDPFPFSLLGMIVAVEAVVLSSFILMRQNRMAKHARATRSLEPAGRSHCRKRDHQTPAHGAVRFVPTWDSPHIAEDKELLEFSQATSVEKLAERLDEYASGGLMAGLLRLARAGRHHVLFRREGARGGGSTGREKECRGPRTRGPRRFPAPGYVFHRPRLWATAQDCTAPEN